MIPEYRECRVWLLSVLWLSPSLRLLALSAAVLNLLRIPLLLPVHHTFLILRCTVFP